MSIPTHIRLSDLSRQIGSVLKQHFSSQLFWVVAEISTHKFYPNQDRHYLELVEKADQTTEPMAKFRAVAWQEGTAQIASFEANTGQVFQTGLEVLIQVKVEFHSLFGLSLVILNIDPLFTLGKIEQQKRETLSRLITQNPGVIEKVGDQILSRNKRLELAPVIQKIAVLSSPNSEGFKDFMHTLEFNHFKYTFSIDIYQTSVQGADAGPELIRKLIGIYESGKNYQAIAIIRGGGSKTDFMVFDSYEVARAVARFPLPIITGIGHLGDVSITDLLTHTSTKTPTKAAEFIIAHNRSFEDGISSLQKIIAIKSHQSLAKLQSQLADIKLTLVSLSRNTISDKVQDLYDCRQFLVNQSSRVLYSNRMMVMNTTRLLISRSPILLIRETNKLELLQNSIFGGADRFISSQKTKLIHLQAMINALNPMNLLKKGFALIYKNQQLLLNSNKLQKEDEVQIQMMDGVVSVIVTNIKKSENDRNEL